MPVKTHFAFAAFLCMFGATDRTQAADTALSSEVRLGACTAKDVRKLFWGPSDRRQIRVLVTRFAGTDDVSTQFGVQVGTSLRDALTPYAREALDLQNSGLLSKNLQVRYIGCVVGDHDRARLLGRAASADVVLWGQTYCNRRHPTSCQQVDLHLEGANSNNRIENSPGATMINQITVKNPSLPEAEDAFKTSLTVVRWLGLDADADNPVRVHSRVELAGANLPRLASRRLKVLLDFVLGLYALHAGRHGLAVKFFDSIEKVTAGVEGAHNLHRMAGMSFVIAGQTDRGLAALQKAHELCQPNDATCRYRTLYRLGWAKARTGHLAEALQHYQDVLVLVQNRNRWFEGSALNRMGHVYAAIGNQKKGQELCEQGRQICRNSGARSCEAEALKNLGDAAADLGSLPDSMELYNQALQIFRKVGDLGGQAATLGSLGRDYLVLGNTDRAQELHEQALSLYQKVGDQQGIAATLCGMGHVAEGQGEYQKAKTLYEQALPITTLAKDRQGEAAILSSMGHAEETLDQQRAKKLYEQAGLLYKQVGDSQGEAAALDSLGKLQADFGQATESITDYERAATLFLVRNPPDQTRAMASLQRGLLLAEQHGLISQAAALQTKISRLIP